MQIFRVNITIMRIIVWNLIDQKWMPLGPIEYAAMLLYDLW